MKATYINPARVTVEGGGGFPLGLVVLAVLVVAAAGPAAAAASAAWHVLRVALWFGGALAFSAGCGLFARWFGQRERERAAKSQAQVERVPDWAARGKVRQ